MRRNFVSLILLTAVAVTGCSSESRTARLSASGAGRPRRAAAAYPVRVGKVVAQVDAARPARHRHGRSRHRRWKFAHRSPASSRRSASRKATTSQQGAGALHARSASARSGAEAGRSQPAARHRAGGQRRSPGAAAVRPRRSAASSTREQVDTSRATPRRWTATLEADRAAVENARIQLQYATIAAPITGRTGALMVHEGNLVRANDTTPLVVINQLSPINVTVCDPRGAAAASEALHGDGARVAVEAAPPNDGDRAVDRTRHVRGQRGRSDDRAPSRSRGRSRTAIIACGRASSSTSC